MEKSHSQSWVELENPRDDDPPRPRVHGLLRVVVCLSLVALLLFTGAVFSFPGSRFFSCHGSRGPLHHVSSMLALEDSEPPLMEPLQGDLSRKIPFEAHIMSKCPDAQACIQKLVVPAMEQISDKVDFNLSFIANVSGKSSDIHCKHGPTECIGDILMLCAANLPFPPENSRLPIIRSLGFANCLIASYSDIPERSLVEHCALQHGVDFDALNRCASQQDDDPEHSDKPSGIALLRQSALRSSELGVSTSCTVRLDDDVWCVRDDGAWKDCAYEGKGSEVSVLVDEIKKLAEAQ